VFGRSGSGRHSNHLGFNSSSIVIIININIIIVIIIIENWGTA
jgi:hypothetical protein